MERLYMEMLMSEKVKRQPPGHNGFKYRQQYGVIVVCADESAQKKVYLELKRQGYACKVVTV